MELAEHEANLLRQASAAALRAYCPYSGFAVGAAAATELGVFVGANVENASFGLTLCAERVALANAITAGAIKISLLAVAGPPDQPTGLRSPCGACRQVMVELMTPDAVLIQDNNERLPVAGLLPGAFRRPAAAAVEGI
ncbi:MAG: cytidine deaminase [Armatimonadetes bacterium]|nr:cytidine deaminase [Armatimonadota bacterium]MDE2207842.1 cytidine deaminase [Armatimonadota bacterium]